MTLSRRQALAVGIAATLPVPAIAQAPRPVTIVVAFPPGGDVDTMARLLAERLASRLGRPVVVENRAGASGTIGAQAVARAAPDGDTLIHVPSTFAIAPHVLRATPTYDAVNDFTPIITTGSATLILVAGRQSGLRTLADFIAAARAGRVSGYGSPGSGSPMNVLAEMFHRAANIQVPEIAYRGVAPVVNDLLSGTVPVGWVTPAVVLQHIQSGAMVPLVVSEAERNPIVPQVPTFRESGFDIAFTSWYGLLGPRGMAPATVATLNRHMHEILTSADMTERLRGLGIIAGGGTPERLGDYVRTDSERFGRIVRELNIQAS
jgi:tripartite-type tricarboxylate transporter receptor subunit TctC